MAGAHDDAIEGVEVGVLEALAFARGEADHQDLLDADGYVLGTTANFGYMSGAMKHVFDSTFLQVGGALSDDGSGAESAGATARRPFGLYVHGRYDTTGAVRSVLVDHRRAGLEAGVRRARGDGRGDRERTPSRRTSSAVRSRHCSPGDAGQPAQWVRPGSLDDPIEHVHRRLAEGCLQPVDRLAEV